MFTYQHNQLHCEEVPLAEIAAELGTPAYVYSQATLLQRVERLLNAVTAVAPRHLACYAVKANSNPTLLRLLHQAGLGADVSSGGELFLARHAGFPPQQIIFSGVGKTPAEIRLALEGGVRGIHVESAGELEIVARIAGELQVVAPVGVRLNPDVAASTHPYISTGRREHKFGLPPAGAQALLRQAAAHPWLRPVALHMHIGSQITDLAPYATAVEKLVEVADELAASGIRLQYLDVGGGLGIDYEGQGAPDPADWVRVVAPPVVAAGYGLVLEPGRSVVAPAGVLLLTVLYTKRQGERNFVICDGGMNVLLRPALYDAYHPILPLRRDPDANTRPVEVVGPVCETGDVLAHQRPLPPFRPGDQLAVLHTGAYGYAMSSNYNGHPRPVEALVAGRRFQIIRRRETYADLLT